jgi:hypothetical protein
MIYRGKYTPITLTFLLTSKCIQPNNIWLVKYTFTFLMKKEKRGVLFGGYSGNAITVKVLSFTYPVPMNGYTLHSILMVYVPGLTLGR